MTILSMAIALLLFVLGAVPALLVILPSLVRYGNRRRESVEVGRRTKPLRDMLYECKEIMIVAGELNPWVFDDLADFLATELAKPSHKEVQIRILCGPKIGRRSDKQPNKLRNYVERGIFDNRVKIKYLATRPVLHFAVGDGRQGYIEETHGDGCDELVGTRRGQIFHNSIFKGPDLAGQFERLWASGPFVERPEDMICKKDHKRND